MDEFKAKTAGDPVLSQLKEFVRHGISRDMSLDNMELKTFVKFISDIYELDGLLFVHGKLIVPMSMRSEVLKLLHEGHLGIEKCKGLARSCIYWPGLSRDIEQFVAKCSTCNSFCRQQQKEPLLPHVVPELPWQKLGIDIFQLFNKDYLLVVDYYSKFPEVSQLANKSASCVISHLKSQFARYGVPREIVADNVPFSAAEIIHFGEDWGFKVTTSSPRYPQSNGMAERAIQTVKRLLKKAEHSGTDPYLALLQYRNAPVSGLSVSPAQLLMSRRLRSKLPVLNECLKPTATDAHQELSNRQMKQKEFYDRHARPLPELNEGDVIRVSHDGQWESGIVTKKLQSPRSFSVKTESGSILRRNRRHLVKSKESPPDCSVPLGDDFPDISDQHRTEPDTVADTDTSRDNSKIVTKAGRVVKLPVRFKDYYC